MLSFAGSIKQNNELNTAFKNSICTFEGQGNLWRGGGGGSLSDILVWRPKDKN